MTKIVDLIFPRACGLCGQKINERYTCRKCLNILEYYHEKVVLDATEHNSFDKLICGFEYKSCMKNWMLQFKFENKRYLAKCLADLLAYRLEQHNMIVDVILPVPIHRKRKKERGYNQCDYLTKYVSKLLNVPYFVDVLNKEINTPKQSLLDFKHRKTNVQGAYSTKKEELIINKRVLLIDDIYTTGATVNECSKVLKKAGAKEVIVATVLYGG